MSGHPMLCRSRMAHLYSSPHHFQPHVVNDFAILQFKAEAIEHRTVFRRIKNLRLQFRLLMLYPAANGNTLFQFEH